MPIIDLMDAIEDVLISLRRVIRATDLHSRHLVKTAGLTAPQLLLLQTIRNLGEVTIGKLAREMSLSQATVTTILDRLEKRELAYRSRSQHDKRKVHAHLTEQGQRILKDAPTPLQEHFIRRFQQLEEWEQTMILSSLQRVAQMMDAQDIDASPVLDIGALDRPGADGPESTGESSGEGTGREPEEGGPRPGPGRYSAASISSATQRSI